jgi:4'-phosphopantetheinyl transferase EntD
LRAYEKLYRVRRLLRGVSEGAAPVVRGSGVPYLSAAVAGLFPPGVVAAELHGPAEEGALSLDEARSCERFTGKRVADFAAGRVCARRVLKELGYAHVPLLIGVDRRPLWPSGIVGSISHTDGFCAVVAARSHDYLSIGVDAEIVGRVGEDLWTNLFTPAELTLLRARPAAERATRASIVFSAKEAFYKCQFGVTAAWLDFTDVTVSLEESDAGFGKLYFACVDEKMHASMPSEGRFALRGDHVLAGVAIANARQPRRESIFRLRANDPKNS